MRTYGMVPLEAGGYQWIEVDTAENGDNSAIWLTTLCQVLLLDRNESPFYANYGVPVLESLQNQIPPDLYVAQTQAQFAPFFAALTVARGNDANGNPTYNIKALTKFGAVFSAYAGQPVIAQ